MRNKPMLCYAMLCLRRCELNDDSLADNHKRSKITINPILEFHYTPGGSKGNPLPNGVDAPPSKDYSRINKDITNNYINSLYATVTSLCLHVEKYVKSLKNIHVIALVEVHENTDEVLNFLTQNGFRPV